MGAIILEILKNIPLIFSVIREVMDMIKDAKEKDRLNIVNETAKAYDDLKQSKTPEQKRDAAKKLAKIISSM
jgi:hypothetical protein